MGNMACRVAKGLLTGCALLLGVSVTACGASQYTDVSSTGRTVDFKVPAGWHQISPSSLASEVETETGSTGGSWIVAYEAGSHPTANDFLGFDTAQPFAFAETGTLVSSISGKLSYDALRDFFLPVTSAARANAIKQNVPLSAFKQIRDQVLTPGNGVHGVRETFDYTYTDGFTDTFDEVVLTNARETQVYLLILHCTTSCYSANQTQINGVMSSFTVSNGAPYVP